MAVRTPFTVVPAKAGKTSPAETVRTGFEWGFSFLDADMGIIYCAQNKVNGKRYIGQTTRTIDDRKIQHESAARRKPKTCCVAFCHALRKYGFANFEWTILHPDVPDDQIDQLEMNSIAEYKTLSPGGYNLKDGGSNGMPCEETKSRMRAASNRPEVKAARSTGISAAHQNRTPEQKSEISRRISAGHQRRTPEQTAEAVQKRKSAVQRQTPERKAETTQKRIAAATANHQNRTPERRAEISKNMVVAQNRPETKAARDAAWQCPEVKSRHHEAIIAAHKRPEVKAAKSALMIAVHANRTPEQRAEMNRKMLESRRRHPAKTTEQKKESHRKAWETRRRKMALGQETT